MQTSFTFRNLSSPVCITCFSPTNKHKRYLLSLCLYTSSRHFNLCISHSALFLCACVSTIWQHAFFAYWLCCACLNLDMSCPLHRCPQGTYDLLIGGQKSGIVWAFDVSNVDSSSPFTPLGSDVPAVSASCAGLSVGWSITDQKVSSEGVHDGR
jgi:hypothetical protein